MQVEDQEFQIDRQRGQASASHKAGHSSGDARLRWMESRALRSMVLLGIILAAIIARHLLLPVFGLNYPFVLFFPAVMIIAALGGFWPGLFATICFAAFSAWRLLPHPLAVAELIALGIFVAFALVMSVIGEWFRRSRGALRTLAQRKEQERRLAEQARLLDLSNDAIVVRDPQDRVTYWNRAAVELYGYAAEEALGRVSHELLRARYPESRERVVERLHRENRWAGEVVHTRKDGSSLTVISRWVLDRDKHGKPAAILETNNDVTERLRAEQKVRETGTLLERALSAETVGVLFFNLDGRITDANSTFARMTGYTREELVNAVHWKMLTAPECFEPTMRAAAELAERGKTAPYEKQMIRKDGSTWWGLFAPSPLSGSGLDTQCVEFIIDITERKRAEQALRESDDRYRSFLANSSEGMWRLEFDPPIDALGTVEEQVAAAYRNGRFAECNEAMARMYGLASANELVGKTLDFMLPLDEPAAREYLAMIVQSGYRVTEVESVERNARGETVYFANSMVGTVEDARLLRLWGTQRDITQRKRMEEALREQFELTRTITDNATTAIFMTDDQSRCTFMNPAAERMTGFRFEEVRGGVLHDFIHHHRPGGEPHPISECWVVRALPEQSQVVSQEDVFIRKSGEFFPVLVNAKPIRRDGKAVGTVIEVRDVTEQKRAEAVAREHEEVLRAVTTEARVGLVMVNHEHRYLFANQTYAEIFGLTDAHIVGKRVAEVLPLVYDVQIKPRLERGLAGERVNYELHMPELASTGEERFYDVTYEPRNDHRGRYVVVVVVDITERKKRQEILERTVADRTAKLAETVQQLETFSYSVVHDMRAPLRSMRSFAHLLGEEYGTKLDAEARHYLKRIQDSASGMDALITDVLSYSRVTSSDALATRVDLGALVRDIVEHYPQFQDGRESIEIMSPLPPVSGNRALLTQCISNLLGNALKFVPPGQKPRVVIRAERAGANVRLWVEDNGIGIAPEFHRKIFGLFERLHRSDEYPGTGVGLAIVKKAVERMRGQVGFESEPGKGSRFWIELPAAE